MAGDSATECGEATLVPHRFCRLFVVQYTSFLRAVSLLGLEHLQLAPLSFSLACGCVLPSSFFSPALVSPCASRTWHGLTTRHFSHWPRRTRTITIGPFPPCGATGDVGSARGRKRGGIEAVRWGSVSAHRPPVIVQSCTWYCLTMRHFPGWPRRTPHSPASLCPSNVPDDLAWPSAQTRGK
jgi:hypothetical protein